MANIQTKTSTELLAETEKNLRGASVVWLLFGIGLVAVQWLGFTNAKNTEFEYQLWLACGVFLILERSAIKWVTIVVAAIKEAAESRTP
jgi:hypothetical protein